jgi:3-phenylpropionate/trans-cinnamate dioxygenase ferredoxin reductase subunit
VIDDRVVVVGGGLAGASTAIALRRAGHSGPITVLGDEEHLPYQRPPLSKAVLKTASGIDALHVRPAAFYAEHDIRVRTGARVVAVDRESCTAALEEGAALPYDHLVLATGTRPRPLPGAEGCLELRTWADALALRAALRPGMRLVLVGGGFVGLEVAAVAAAIGAEVTVVEGLDRVLRRALSPEMSAHLEGVHREEGVRIVTGETVSSFEDGGVVLGSGERLPADVVAVGIGVVPNAELAAEAGLVVRDGIVVDDELRTSDERIWAVGDVARFPCLISGRDLRLESVQAAADQAVHVAGRIAGTVAGPYRAVPHFWSEQHGRRLLIAGVAAEGDEAVVRGDPASGPFSICRFAGDRLVAVETIDQGRDHLAARKLLAGDTAALDRAALEDPGVALASLVARPVTGRA